MNHIENDIPESVAQIQPDNHQAGQIAQDSNIATLFARLQPQDVEQFYQSYQLWSITSRIQAIQAEIEQVQQEKAVNAELLEQYHPSPIAQAVLAQLQSHDVNDNDLLDQMLERGDDWLDHTMQLLEQCEHLDIIHGNYTEWCMHALEGAYDWIGSMHESEATDEPEEPATTAEVFDESTEQLLLQKLLSDEEEAIQPEARVEPAEEATISEETVTSPSPEDAAAETATQEEAAQIAETSNEEISSDEESEAPGELAADNEAEEDVPSSDISETIEIIERETDQADELEEPAQQISPMVTSDANAVLNVDISAPTDTSDEAEDNIAEIEPEIASGTTETTIHPEEVEIQEEETTPQASVEDQDAVVEPVENEQATSEVLTEDVDEVIELETLEQDAEQESEEQEIQVKSLSEAADSPEVEDTIGNNDEAPVEMVAEDATSNGEEVTIETTTEDVLEPESQTTTSIADEEGTDTASTTPEVEELPENEEEVEVTSEEVLETASDEDENDEADNDHESVAAPTDAVDEVVHEPAAVLNHDVQDNSDLTLAENLLTQEESSSDLSLPSASTEIKSVEAEIPHALHMEGSDEDTIAIPAILKTTFSTSRITPLRATVDAETQPTMPTIVPDKTTTPAQEIASIVEANTIPGLPAITPPPQAITPSTTSLPDIYGETSKQPAIQQAAAPIWRESSDYSTSLNPSLPQTPSTLLPEPHQGFFRRLWLKFLAWLRGE
ncbi:hypothetical protein KSF_056150 [Reticulibacter mediterranei]|uniref:Uncharacterized protein n=1 Tax=Reticulibacter mediterranei TaxID=2778369 RepID=A0A8J3N5W7_9CHLR|nr:hypothetical protein [Reticulibacter mediterranei]GHO95567.1 hypothetical protein KSF_056150 [Reticulibacter mediterranei]